MNRRTLLAAGVGLSASALLPSSAIAAPPRSLLTTGRQKIAWVWAHPDDETIAGGLSLRQHIEAKAGDGSPAYEIHVVVSTRGTGTGVLPYLNGEGPAPDKLADWAMPHNPADEGYLAGDLTDGKLTQTSLGAARIREWNNALGVLQSGTGNTVFRHEFGLTDTQITTAAVVVAIQDLYTQICAPGEPLWLKGHTWLMDANPDHLAVGHALKQLGPMIADGNVRYYTLPKFFTDTRIAQHPVLPATGTFQAAAALNAAKAYNSWAPWQGLYAIGHQSVPGDWLASPKNQYHV